MHGVGGATPEEMLDDAWPVRIAGDRTAALFRHADDVDADLPREPDPGPDRGQGQGQGQGRGRDKDQDRASRGPVPEAYVWSHLTSGDGSRALWLLLLPFMVVNLAHWMRPSTHGHARTVRWYGVLVRLAGLTLTVLLVAAASEVALDLTAWQCAGTAGCVATHSWLGFLSPEVSGGGWWSGPGRRLALAAVIPAALTGLLWFLSLRTWSAYESQRPVTPEAEADGESVHNALGRPGFWYGRRLVARLRSAHTAAGLLTVTAAVGTAVARYDRRPGGPAALDTLGRILEAALVVGAVTVVWVVCRRGRSEDRLDQVADRLVVRGLPLAALALLLLALGHALWPRPGWQSVGRLPGDTGFGMLSLAQGLLVVLLAVTAWALHRTHPDPRAALRGLAGPATALLACALGGVMSGGVAQRVADWLDGTGDSIPGPPVVLTWQASAIPPLLAVLLVVCVVLVYRAWLRARRGTAEVERDYRSASKDAGRVRRIARVRALASLTDQVPLVMGVTAGATLLLGAAALLGATTGEPPAEAADGSAAVLHGAAELCQALGSWLIGLGFVLFVTWGRRAYKDPGARRTIGILWDVGTFWPRAAHPFAPPCYAERAVPDLTWRMASWTAATGGRLVLSGHSQGSVLAAAAAWQLKPAARGRVALLTYGSPLERLYGRWFPAYFGPAELASLHREADCWRNLYRLTDPIGGPVRVPRDHGPAVDRAPLKDPLAFGRTTRHPLPTPILGHGDYQADPAFAEERERLLARLRPEVPGPRS